MGRAVNGVEAMGTMVEARRARLGRWLRGLPARLATLATAVAVGLLVVATGVPRGYAADPAPAPDLPPMDAPKIYTTLPFKTITEFETPGHWVKYIVSRKILGKESVSQEWIVVEKVEPRMVTFKVISIPGYGEDVMPPEPLPEGTTVRQTFAAVGSFYPFVVLPENPQVSLLRYDGNSVVRTAGKDWPAELFKLSYPTRFMGGDYVQKVNIWKRRGVQVTNALKFELSLEGSMHIWSLYEYDGQGPAPLTPPKPEEMQAVEERALAAEKAEKAAAEKVAAALAKSTTLDTSATSTQLPTLSPKLKSLQELLTPTAEPLKPLPTVIPVPATLSPGAPAPAPAPVATPAPATAPAPAMLTPLPLLRPMTARQARVDALVQASAQAYRRHYITNLPAGKNAKAPSSLMIGHLLDEYAATASVAAIEAAIATMQLPPDDRPRFYTALCRGLLRAGRFEQLKALYDAGRFDPMDLPESAIKEGVLLPPDVVDLYLLRIRQGGTWVGQLSAPFLAGELAKALAIAGDPAAAQRAVADLPLREDVTAATLVAAVNAGDTATATAMADALCARAAANDGYILGKTLDAIATALEGLRYGDPLVPRLLAAVHEAVAREKPGMGTWWYICAAEARHGQVERIRAWLAAGQLPVASLFNFAGLKHAIVSVAKRGDLATADALAALYPLDHPDGLELRAALAEYLPLGSAAALERLKRLEAPTIALETSDRPHRAQSIVRPLALAYIHHRRPDLAEAIAIQARSLNERSNDVNIVYVAYYAQGQTQAATALRHRSRDILIFETIGAAKGLASSGRAAALFPAVLPGFDEQGQYSIVIQIMADLVRQGDAAAAERLRPFLPQRDPHRLSFNDAIASAWLLARRGDSAAAVAFLAAYFKVNGDTGMPNRTRDMIFDTEATMIADIFASYASPTRHDDGGKIAGLPVIDNAQVMILAYAGYARGVAALPPAAD